MVTRAYSARTAHPFRRNGAPFRFKLSHYSLYVPRAWNVDVNVDKAFGGINMRGRMEGTSTHRLVVTGETNFGALTIVFI